MTLPAPLWMHNHVSEREVARTWPDGQKDDSRWEDCMWCSVVEWLNDTWKDVPDTSGWAFVERNWRLIVALVTLGAGTFLGARAGI